MPSVGPDTVLATAPAKAGAVGHIGLVLRQFKVFGGD